MPEDGSNKKTTSLSLDGLIRGVLARTGEIFDRLLGRQAKTASSLATSELATRTKKILDAQVREVNSGKFVPHIIQLKIEWGKFSDTPESMASLENEILAAVLDHINDNRYLTYAPLKITAKPDYFTTGVHIVTSFGKFDKSSEDVDLSVTVPNINVAEMLPEPQKPAGQLVFVKYSLHGEQKEIKLEFQPGERLNVGRSWENDLALKDDSVSKLHAALSFNSEGQLVVADIGSTNGTFINKERLAYGKAFPLKEGDMVEFGTVPVFFEHVITEPEEVKEETPESAPEESNVEAVEDPEGVIRIELN